MGQMSNPSLSPQKQFVGVAVSNIDRESMAGTVLPPDYSQSVVNQNIENESENNSSIAKLKEDLNPYQNRLLSQKTDLGSEYKLGGDGVFSLDKRKESEPHNATAQKVKQSDRKEIFNNSATP